MDADKQQQILGLLSLLGRDPSRLDERGNYWEGGDGKNTFQRMLGLGSESPQDTRARLQLAQAQKWFGQNPSFYPGLGADPLTSDPQYEVGKIQRGQMVDAGMNSPSMGDRAGDLFMYIMAIAHAVSGGQPGDPQDPMPDGDPQNRRDRYFVTQGRGSY